MLIQSIDILPEHDIIIEIEKLELKRITELTRRILK